jgi:cytochrome c-type biogenesis protein
MLSGVGVDQLRQGQGPRGELLRSALAFVIGFSIVFVSFGASASAVGTFLQSHRSVLTPLAGGLILLFGLHLLGWLVKISLRLGFIIGGLLVAGAIVMVFAAPDGFGDLRPVHLIALSLIFLLGPALTRWLNRDVHFRNMGGQPGMVSGFLMGFAFAFGWTPCIGPILSAVLILAAAQETVMRGVFLLAAYSAGLAIPFVLTALGIGQFLKFYQRFRKHIHLVEVFSGALLVAVGGLIFMNRLTWLSGKLAFLNYFSR